MSEFKKMKEDTVCGKAGENETSKIERLSDDCLIEIFQRLPTIADKIRIERVCKRWQYVSQMSWNNFQSLDLSAKMWGMEEYRDNKRLIKSVDYNKIVRLSGRNLTSISTDLWNFAKMCHLLPKLRRLQLIDQLLEASSQCTRDTWQVILDWLLCHGENITHFKIIVVKDRCTEKEFAHLLGKMKQLKSFALYKCNDLAWKGTFLLELPFEKIQEIVLSRPFNQHYDINLLSTMIRKCKKLQTLCIDLEREEDLGILKLLPLHAASLKNLKLRLDAEWSREWQSVLLSTVTALTHLEKLDLSQCYHINDEVLEVVSKNCKKLTYFNLDGCKKVTDRGISVICNLGELTYLNIGRLRKIRNPPLEKLSNLVVLNSMGTLYLQEECLCNFLTKAHQLRALVLTCNHLDINKLLCVAINVARFRKSSSAVDLYVLNGNKIDMAVMAKKPPLLNIINSAVASTSLAKYGIEDPFSIEPPEISIRK